MSAVRIAVNGATGRMGRSIARLAAGMDDMVLVGGTAFSRYDESQATLLGFPRIESIESAGPILESVDVIVDFSAPEALENLLDRHADMLAGRALVVGTTGLSDTVRDQIDAIVQRSPVLVASNFSIGVNLMLELVERAARALPAADYDVEIVEAHHRRKLDAPSGTALALGEAVAHGRAVELEAVRLDGRTGATGERPVGEIAFHSLRGGDVVGEHTVAFLGARERIEIVHAASDRALFAEGALVAARWIAGKEPGRYSMSEVLGL